jgi:uncharacterized protein YlxP (DUF503 family)
MVVGVLHVKLRLSDVHSLKGKRGQVKKVINRVRNTFPVAVAEVGSNDAWQRAEIGVSSVGNSAPLVNASLDHVLNFIEGLHIAEVVDHKMEIIHC